MEEDMALELGFEVHLDQSYEEALESVTAALKAEGFGVLTEIDVKATLKKKLGEDFRPYSILGACNPPLAHRALMANAEIGLMLPCNVTVEADPAGGSIVRILNPDMMVSAGDLGQNAVLLEVASEARAKLERVAESLRQD
jgi:uncharacterized protein (DUF302 family)